MAHALALRRKLLTGRQFARKPAVFMPLTKDGGYSCRQAGIDDTAPALLQGMPAGRRRQQ